MLRIERFGYMSEELQNKLCRFVCDNVYSVLNIIPIKDYILLFPETFRKLHREENCEQVFSNLLKKISEENLFYKLSPLESYVLYQSIQYRLRKYRIEVRESRKLKGIFYIYFDVPEKLLISIRSELNRKMNEYDEDLTHNILKQISTLYEYDALLFTNFYFEKDMLASLVNAYEKKNQLFFDYLDQVEELEAYAEVMPWDLYNQYLTVKQLDFKKINYEKEINEKILSILQTNSLIGKNKYEVTSLLIKELSDSLQELKIGMKTDCLIRKICIESNEIYMYKDSPYIIHPLSIVNVDYVLKFDNQIQQLLEKMDSYYKFGITISLNQNLSTISNVQIIEKNMRQIKELVSYKKLSFKNREFIQATYTSPITKKEIRIYHLFME